MKNIKTIKSVKNRIKKVIAIVLVTGLILGCSSGGAFGASLAKVSLNANQTARTTSTLSWKEVDGADGYQIYRKVGTDGSYKLVKTISKGSTLSYKDKGLTFGKTYRYKVRAFDKAGGKTVKGKYSSVKAVTMSNMKPSFTVYVPTSIDKDDKSIVITITNSSKSASTYLDGSFAIENLADGGKLYNAKCIKFCKPEKKIEGTIEAGSRLLLRPGEKVRLTCELDRTFDYNRNDIRVTTCLRYKKQDYVSVYSIDEKNKVFTAEEYFDYLTGQE